MRDFKVVVDEAVEAVKQRRSEGVRLAPRDEDVAYEICHIILRTYPQIAPRLREDQEVPEVLPAIFTPLVAKPAPATAASGASTPSRPGSPDDARHAFVPALAPPDDLKRAEDSFAARAMTRNATVKRIYDDLNAKAARATRVCIRERMEKYEKRFRQFGAWRFEVPDDGVYFVLLYDDMPNMEMNQAIAARWPGARGIVYYTKDFSAEVADTIDFTRVFRCYRSMLSRALVFARYDDLDAAAPPLQPTTEEKSAEA